MNVARRPISIVLSMIPVLLMATMSAEPGVPGSAPVPLPNPLSLNQAIELSAADHPDLELATSRLYKSKARLKKRQSERGFDLDLSVIGQTVDPVDPLISSTNVDDSMAVLLLSKPIYDFGKSGNRVASAKASLEGEWSRYFDARQKRRLEIMALFFDVLLADLRYRVDDETMARVYVTYDKIRQRHELGQFSDVELLDHESRYREALGKRVRAQSQRRATRARLAIGMNRPDDLADELTPPILDNLDRKLPDYDDVVKRVLETNPIMVALRHDVVSSERDFRAAKAYRRPELKAELEASQFQRRMGMRNDSRASLVMKWPIFRGGENDARKVEAEADLREQRARLRRYENNLRQQTLELLQRIEVLQYQRKAAKTLVDFRDLELDQSRALYELEARATLGDAMIGVTEAQWKAAKVNYELALAWARFKALSGELVEKTAEEKYR